MNVKVIYDSKTLSYHVLADGKVVRTFDAMSDDYAQTNASEYAARLRQEKPREQAKCE